MVRRLTLVVGGLLFGIWTVESAAQPAANNSPSPRPTQMEPLHGDSAQQEYDVNQAFREVEEQLGRLEDRISVDPDDPELERIWNSINLIEKRDPSNARLSLSRARVLALRGLASDASIELLKFVETGAGATEWLAFRLLGDGFVVEYPRLAKSHYEKAAALNPAEPSVLYGLSICAMKLGALQKAVTLARDTVVADGRRSVRFLAHLAAALQADRKWDEALREAELSLGLALRQSAENPTSRSALIVVNTQYGLLKSILYGRIQDPTVNAVSDYLRLATCVRQHIQITEKLTLYEVLRIIEAAVRESAPQTPTALLHQYGILLADVGRTADAITVFQRVLQVESDNTDAADHLRQLRKEQESPGPAK